LVVIDGAHAGTSRHVKFKLRETEGILYIDGDYTDPEPVVGSGPDGVLLCPLPRLFSPFLIEDLPDLADFLRIEVRGKGKFSVRHIGPPFIQRCLPPP
jgi:hypothetical protein